MIKPTEETLTPLAEDRQPILTPLGTTAATPNPTAEKLAIDFMISPPPPPRNNANTSVATATSEPEEPNTTSTGLPTALKKPWQGWQAKAQAEELPVVDTILERCWPYFLTEGIAFGIFGFMAVVLPAVLGADASADFMGILFVMCAIMQLVRAYTARELPGFLPSLIAAVFTLNIGALIFAYPTDRSISTPLGLCLFFMVQALSNVFFSQDFRPFPYAQGFLFLGTLCGLFLFLMIIPNVWKDDILQNLLVGTELLLHGAILAGVALGLQRMARGQEALHPLATLQSNQYPFSNASKEAQTETRRASAGFNTHDRSPALVDDSTSPSWQL
jgi:uncharacterized membrane protein HdeD (DUF308 family)